MFRLEKLQSCDSFLGGGFDNRAVGKYATIPGGRGLIALDYQTVIGRYNLNIANSQGLNNFGGPFSFPPPINGSTGLLTSETLLAPDAPIFIIGNGGITSPSVDSSGHPIITEVRSNAFTVADAGYSTAYDSIGPGAGGANPTHIGSTYRDNTIIAWGNVAAGGSIHADIGVSSVMWDPANTDYIITLNVDDAGAATSHTFAANNSSIVATIVGQGLSGSPGIIEVSPVVTVGPISTFTVTTWPQMSTTPTNTFAFMFHVVAK